MSGANLDHIIGRTLGDRYRVVSVIGSGASSEVYRATDLRLGREVAVKQLRAGMSEDSRFIRLFRAEAQLAAQLAHPNILTVFDWSDDADGVDGGAYIVTEFLTGGTLRRVLDTGGTLSLSQTAFVGLQAAQGLAHAHDLGLVHRDIKPANLLFGADGRIHIGDFGIARAVAEAAWTEPEGVLIGTARYAAPEQAAGEQIDGLVDVYSLVLCLVEALTGELPLVRENALGTMVLRQKQDVPIGDEFGPMADILTWAGAAASAERATSAELLDGLLEACRALPDPEPFTLIDLTGGRTDDEVIDLRAGYPAEAIPGDHPDDDAAMGGDASNSGADGMEPNVRFDEEGRLIIEGDSSDLALSSSPAELRPYDIEEDGGVHPQAIDDLLVDIEDGSPCGEPVAESAEIGDTGSRALAGIDVDAAPAVEADAGDEVGAGPAVEADAGDEFGAGPGDRVGAGDEANLTTSYAEPLADIEEGQSLQELNGGPIRIVAPVADVPSDRLSLSNETSDGYVEFDDDEQDRPVGRWVAAMVFVALAFGAVAAGLYLGRDQPELATVDVGLPTTPVPDFAGVTIDQIESEAEAQSWTVLVSERHEDGTAPGQMLAQAPPAGVALPPGAEIEVVLSLGPEIRTVPELVGRSEDDAGTAIAAARLTVGEVTSRTDEQVGPGIVLEAMVGGDGVDQGDEFVTGTTVDLVISAGPAPRTVPDLVGLSVEAAEAEIDSTGLELTTAEAFSETVAEGLIIGSEPGSGAQVSRGSTVTVTVSLGLPFVEIPEVTGLPVLEAIEVLENAGFQVFVDGSVSSTVLTTRPAAGESEREGGRIDVIAVDR